jgi:hypothetical protein
MGCPEGRSSPEWIDFDLYGHQVVAHLAPHECRGAATNAVDGDDVPVRHFGVVLPMAEWQALADRLKAAGTRFIIEPHVRFKLARPASRPPSSSSTRRATRWSSRPSPTSRGSSPSSEHPDPRRRPRRRERGGKPRLRTQRHHRGRHRPGAAGRAAGTPGPARRGGQRHPALGAGRRRHRGRRHADRLRAAGRDQPHRLQGGAQLFNVPTTIARLRSARVPGRRGADGRGRLRGRPRDLPGRLASRATSASSSSTPRRCRCWSSPTAW